jgi:hypothetical protein
MTGGSFPGFAVLDEGIAPRDEGESAADGRFRTSRERPLNPFASAP